MLVGVLPLGFRFPERSRIAVDVDITCRNKRVERLLMSRESLRHGGAGGRRAGDGVAREGFCGRSGRDMARDLRVRAAVACLMSDKGR